MTHPFRASVALVAGLVAYGSVAQAQGEPPGRVGRLAFTEGSVSFHDQDDVAWSKAVVNTPLTSGDSVWTEPSARSELSVAGTRVRLEGGTQLDVLSAQTALTEARSTQVQALHDYAVARARLERAIGNGAPQSVAEK